MTAGLLAVVNYSKYILDMMDVKCIFVSLEPTEARSAAITVWNLLQWCKTWYAGGVDQ